MLFVMAVVQSFLLLVLLWFVLACCYNCLWCSKCHGFVCYLSGKGAWGLCPKMPPCSSSVNQWSPKILGYRLLLWFGRLFWRCLSFSLLSIVVGASNCFILPVMVSKYHENVWRQWLCEELWLLGNQSRPYSWFAGSTIVMFMSLETLRSLSMPSLLN